MPKMIDGEITKTIEFNRMIYDEVLKSIRFVNRCRFTVIPIYKATDLRKAIEPALRMPYAGKPIKL